MTQKIAQQSGDSATPHRILWAGIGAAVLALLVALFVPGGLIAQIEGDRGIAPVLNTGDIVVSDIAVNATGKSAEEARDAGRKMAARLAWQKVNGPQLGDDVLAGMVTQIEVQNEAIGPHRYIATLTVTFDRDHAGQFIGGGQGLQRSAPMLVIPVLYSGGVAQVYEVKGLWQKAWADFRTGTSAINYVRPSGAGSDSLLITAGQPGRRSRLWWRELFSEYSAMDVLVPIARLDRQWPGGPVTGNFTARYGPDDHYLASFTLSAADDSEVPAMLGEAVKRFDKLYTDALDSGGLRGDGVSAAHSQINPGLQAVIDAGASRQAAQAGTPSTSATQAAGASPADTQSATPAADKSDTAGPVSTYVVQFASPDAAAVDAAMGAVRGAPGVASASTSSLAIGGTSVIRVSFAGPLGKLAEALRARGWQVSEGAGALRIHRAGN